MTTAADMWKMRLYFKGSERFLHISYFLCFALADNELNKLWSLYTNFSVLEEVKPKRSLEAAILRLELRYFGHVMRAEGSLDRNIMLAQVAGYRKQGKPRMRWLDSIKEAIGLRLDALKEAVQDRKKWRMLVEQKTRNREHTNVK